MTESKYKVIEVAPGVHAIGEPLYHQQNWTYLICGSERALLFDTGSYFSDITPVVAGLTDLPLMVMPSHMHYDHLGNVLAYDTVVLADLPLLRACEVDGVVTPSETLFLGRSEDRIAPSFAVAEWLAIGSSINLGGAVLTVLHTPGHSPDSVSLWWAERDMLFAADFLYHGRLFAQTPGASLVEYDKAAQEVRALITPHTRILGAHGNADSVEAAQAPELDRSHLDALIAVFAEMRRNPPQLIDGTATVPVTPLNTLIVGADALQGFS